MNPHDLADHFIVFCANTTWRTPPVPLVEQTHDFLLEVLSASGFTNCHCIVPGQLREPLLDEHGSLVKYGNVINSTFPYQVSTPDKKPHFHATCWLNELMELALSDNSYETRTQRVEREIVRSRPLTPIRLTLEEDELLEYPPSAHKIFRDHTTDEDTLLQGCVGIHNYCGGWMDRTQISATHQAIHCRRCHLRIPFLLSVKTYGELRQVYFTNLPW